MSPAAPLIVLTLAAFPLSARAGAAEPVISTSTLFRVIARLSSDEFEGRAPATRGEELSVAYLADEFKKAGLSPGNPDGTYFQSVPLVGLTLPAPPALTFSGSAGRRHAKYGDEFVAWSERLLSTVTVEAPLVFVGYGVVAPEYSWDDYKGTDVKGKILVMLVNDPPVPDPRDPSRLDDGVFGGKAMTYYGRWTYKYEIAAKKGAAGCLIVHETGPAGYPWEVVVNSWSGEQFILPPEDGGRSGLAVQGWLNRDAAAALFGAAGLDFESAKKAAARRDFKPVDLRQSAKLELHGSIRRIESRNVVGKLEGSGPGQDETVVYSAHWDHLGTRQTPRGREIYHGAADNASGCAGLVSLAEAFRGSRPPRTVLFLSPTAEERGLLGSRYYVEHPLYPLSKTVADINMDVLNFGGPTRDIVEVGLGESDLDRLIDKQARSRGRAVSPDPEPEKGFYYRSDHLNFAKAGVPSAYFEPGVDFVGRPAGWGLKLRRVYTGKRYHKPADIVYPDWDLSGAALDLELLYGLGRDLADSGAWPRWEPKSEFQDARPR